MVGTRAQTRQAPSKSAASRTRSASRPGAAPCGATATRPAAAAPGITARPCARAARSFASGGLDAWVKLLVWLALGESGLGWFLGW